MKKFHLNVILYVLLTIFTFGLFDLYWNRQQMLKCNELIGRDEFDFAGWLMLSALTMGIYHIFYQYKLSTIILEIQKKQGKAVSKKLPITSLFVSLIFGGTIIVDALQQIELNRLS